MVTIPHSRRKQRNKKGVYQQNELPGIFICTFDPRLGIPSTLMKYLLHNLWQKEWRSKGKHHNHLATKVIFLKIRFPRPKLHSFIGLQHTPNNKIKMQHKEKVKPHIFPHKPLKQILRKHVFRNSWNKLSQAQMVTSRSSHKPLSTKFGLNKALSSLKNQAQDQQA